MLFTQQLVHCNICGKAFWTAFKPYDGRFCGSECNDEYNWRKTLSIMGKEYYPRDKKPEPPVATSLAYGADHVEDSHSCGCGMCRYIRDSQS